MPIVFEDWRNNHLIAAIGVVRFQVSVAAVRVRNIIEDHTWVPIVIIRGRRRAVWGSG